MLLRTRDRTHNQWSRNVLSIAIAFKLDYKSLKKRVGSYFNKNKHDVKTSVMIKHISKIDFLVVKNEAEALISESNLIKINKPRI